MGYQRIGLGGLDCMEQKSKVNKRKRSTYDSTQGIFAICSQCLPAKPTQKNKSEARENKKNRKKRKARKVASTFQTCITKQIVDREVQIVGSKTKAKQHQM